MQSPFAPSANERITHREDSRSTILTYDGESVMGGFSTYGWVSVQQTDMAIEETIQEEETLNKVPELNPTSPASSRRPRLSFLGSKQHSSLPPHGAGPSFSPNSFRVPYQKPAPPPPPPMTEAERYRKEHYTKGAMSEMRAERHSRFMHAKVVHGEHGALTEDALIANSALSQMTQLRDQYKSVYGPLPLMEEELSMKQAANYLFEQAKLQLAAITIQRGFRRFFKRKYGYDLNEVNPLEIEEIDYSRWDFVDRMMADGERRLVQSLALEEERVEVPAFDSTLRGGPSQLVRSTSRTPRTSVQGETSASSYLSGVRGRGKAPPKRGWVGAASRIEPRSPPRSGGGGVDSKFSSVGPRYGPAPPQKKNQGHVPSRLSQAHVGVVSGAQGQAGEDDDAEGSHVQRQMSESELPLHLAQRRLMGDSVITKGAAGAQSAGMYWLQRARYKDPALQQRLEVYKHHTRWLSRWEERQMAKQVKVINKIEEMQARWKLMGLIPSEKPKTPPAEDSDLVKNLADNPLRSPMRARRPSAGSYRESGNLDGLPIWRESSIDMALKLESSGFRQLRRQSQSVGGSNYFDNVKEEEDAGGADNETWSSKSQSVGLDLLGKKWSYDGQGKMVEAEEDEAESVGAHSRDVIQGSIWCDDQDEDEDEDGEGEEEVNELSSHRAPSSSALHHPSSLRSPSNHSNRVPSHIRLDVASLHSLRMSLLPESRLGTPTSGVRVNHLASRLASSSRTYARLLSEGKAPSSSIDQEPSSSSKVHEIEQSIGPPLLDNSVWEHSSIASHQSGSFRTERSHHDGPALMPQFSHNFAVYRLLQEASKTGNSVLIYGLLDKHDWEPRNVSTWMDDNPHNDKALTQEDGVYEPIDPLPPPETVQVEPVMDFDEEVDDAEDRMLGGLGLSRRYRPMESHLFTDDSRGRITPSPPLLHPDDPSPAGAQQQQQPSYYLSARDPAGIVRSAQAAAQAAVARRALDHVLKGAATLAQDDENFSHRHPSDLSWTPLDAQSFYSALTASTGSPSDNQLHDPPTSSHPLPSRFSAATQPLEESKRFFTAAELYPLNPPSSSYPLPTVLPDQGVTYRGLLSLAHSKGLIPDREWGRTDAPTTQILTNSFKQEMLLQDNEPPSLAAHHSEPSPASRLIRSKTEGGGGRALKTLLVPDKTSQQSYGPFSSPLKLRQGGGTLVPRGTGAWGSPDDFRRSLDHQKSEGGVGERGGNVVASMPHNQRNDIQTTSTSTKPSSSKKPFLPRLNAPAYRQSEPGASQPPWPLPPSLPAPPLDAESSPGGAPGGFFPPVPTVSNLSNGSSSPKGHHKEVKGVYDEPGKGSMVNGTASLVKIFPKNSPFWAVLSSQQKQSLIGAAPPPPPLTAQMKLKPSMSQYIPRRKTQGEINRNGLSLPNRKSQNDLSLEEPPITAAAEASEAAEETVAAEAPAVEPLIPSTLAMEQPQVDHHEITGAWQEAELSMAALAVRVSSELGEPYEGPDLDEEEEEGSGADRGSMGASMNVSNFTQTAAPSLSELVI